MIYRFDKVTGELKSAHPKPSEKVTYRDGTEIVPPAAEVGSVPVFDEATQTWSMVEDHRGTTAFWVSDGLTPVKVTELGPLADQTPPLQAAERPLTAAENAAQDLGLDITPALEDAKAAMIAKIKARFAELSTAPIEYMGDEFHGNTDSVQNIMGTVMMAQMAGTDFSTSRMWSNTDGIPVSKTFFEIAGLGHAIAARKDQLHGAKLNMRLQVNAMTDVADVLNVDVEGGFGV